jgi:hypothetical protein
MACRTHRVRSGAKGFDDGKIGFELVKAVFFLARTAFYHSLFEMIEPVMTINAQFHAFHPIIVAFPSPKNIQESAIFRFLLR